MLGGDVGYAEDLQLAARWIAEQQDAHDGGWGLAANQASSLVNTAEAIDVLREVRTYDEACQRGISFLVEQTFLHTQRRTSKNSVGRGERIRYVAFPLLVLSRFKDEALHLYLERCKTWLLNARNEDHGWGDEANDQASKLFSTFIAIRALQQAKASYSELEHSYTWVRAQSKSDGWSLYPGHPVSTVATAYGILCLTKSPFNKDERVDRAAKFILQNKIWHPTTDDASGTVWQHSTATWVLSALAELGEPPYSPTIAEGVRYLNSLKRREGAPWAETPDHHVFSTRSQYWAVVALRSLQHSFDPSVHALRIDAERASQELTEPTYLKFKIRSAWAIVVPARIYVIATYGCFATALLFAFSFHRLFPEPSKELDILIALSLSYAGWQMMRLRSKPFSPRMRWIAKTVVALGVLAGAWFGKDGYTILSGSVEFVKQWAISGWDFLKAGYSILVQR
jgi:hypothetical protein